MSNEIVFLSDVRLSFPHLIEPQKTVNQQTGKERVSYNCEFIMPESHPGFVQFMQRYAVLAQEKWKEHANAVMQLIMSDRKNRCFGQGAEKINKKTFQPYDGYVGNVFISAGRDQPPQIIQADGSPIDPANTMAYQQLTRKMYGGCRVNAAVKPWIQENTHGRAIRCDLVAVQFFKDDTAFGEGAVDASGMFGAVAAAPSPQPAAMAGMAPGFGMPAAPFGGAPVMGGFASQQPVAPVQGMPGLPPFMTGQ